MGYIVYLTVSLATGELVDNALIFLRRTFPQLEESFVQTFKLHERQSALSKQNPSIISKAISAARSSHNPSHDDSSEDQHALFGLGNDMVSKSSIGARVTDEEETGVFR